MPENNAGTRFNFQITQAFFLRAGKIRHLLLGEFNILNILAALLFYAAVDLRGGQTIILTVITIEFNG